VRRRILLLVLGTTAFGLLLFGAIIVTAIWSNTAAANRDRADLLAQRMALVVENAYESGTGLTQEEFVKLQDDATTLGEGFSASVTVKTEASGGFTANEFEGESWQSAPVEILGGPDGKQVVATVTADVSVDAKRRMVAGQALLILGIGLVTLAVTMTVAWFYTRRLMRPFDDFRSWITSVSSGDRRRLNQRYGVPEIDMVADVLDVGITRFDEMIEREREAAAHAGHQLKSPLTAISLRLEEVVATDDLDVAHEEGARALDQVERLSRVVDEVMDSMRGQRSSAPVDFAVVPLVEEQVAEWAEAFQSQGRDLRISERADVAVHAERGAQAQVLAALLENALVHGAGPTQVRVRRLSGWASVEVSDQGPGIPEGLEDSVFERGVSSSGSSGLGLTVARTLLAADGGRIELMSARPAVFAVLLPALEEDDVESAAPAVSAQPARVVLEPEGPEPDQAEVATAASSAAAGSSGNTQRR
jgi:signal transduction histidine kinase